MTDIILAHLFFFFIINKVLKKVSKCHVETQYSIKYAFFFVNVYQ